MAEGPGHVRYSRDYAARRKVAGERADLNRLYVAESFPTVTGGAADHRLPVPSARVEALAAPGLVSVSASLARSGAQ